MGCGVVRIGAQDSREEVIKPLRGMEIEVAVTPRAYPDAGAGNDEPADTVGAAVRGWPGLAETLFEPEGNAGLVAYLMHDREVGEEVIGSSDHGILGLPGRVGIPVEDVVVTNVGPGRLARERIPDRVEETARNEPSLTHAQGRQTLKDQPVGIVGKDQRQELVREVHLCETDALRSGAT